MNNKKGTYKFALEIDAPQKAAEISTAARVDKMRWRLKADELRIQVDADILAALNGLDKVLGISPLEVLRQGLRHYLSKPENMAKLTEWESKRKEMNSYFSGLIG